MKFRKFKADRIFTGMGWAPEGQVLVTNASGQVQAFVEESEAGEEIQYFPGILMPGLINAHCHLELSHLRGLVPTGTGLPAFLQQVVTKRGTVEVDVQTAIRDADHEMHQNGIVAVGDICNTLDSFETKSQSDIHWTNFVEVLSFRDETAAERIKHYQEIRDKFRELPQEPYFNKEVHRSSLVPHAPYSISPLSFELINQASANEIISMHNQETQAEDELYQTGSGDFLALFELFGNVEAPNPVTGKSSLSSVLPYFNLDQSILLIHNTCTKQEDVQMARALATERGLTITYCLCPNANLYIENRLPPAAMLLSEGVQIVLGTDSLSSNYQLSIAEEISAIRKGFPQIPLETVLQWATLNGAKALKRDDVLGSFDKGKSPGLVVLDEQYRASRIL
jgi:cytosine/adenosine deaminase-related metal-dependent hydrolase